jgi:uncharacterized Fe-S cluster-containing protein
MLQLVCAVEIVNRNFGDRQQTVAISLDVAKALVTLRVKGPSTSYNMQDVKVKRAAVRATGHCSVK